MLISPLLDMRGNQTPSAAYTMLMFIKASPANCIFTVEISIPAASDRRSDRWTREESASTDYSPVGDV